MRPGVVLMILAGGRGQRLGGAIKPLLKLDRGSGPTILETVEKTLSPLCEETVLIAPAEVATRLYKVSKSRLVEDRGRGPGEALLDAARSVAAEWFFVVAADQPCPSVQLYSRLVKAITGEADAVAVRENGSLFPTYTLYRRDALLAITRVEGAHGVSMRGLLDALDVVAIDAAHLTSEEKRALLDADTPEQALALGLAFDPGSNG